MMRAPRKGAPLSTRSGNAMPPHDKQNGGLRPVVPTLSAANSKTVNKTPLTPRVAGSTPSLTSSPLTRRGARQESNTTPTLSQKDEFSTPLSSLLNTNITPRSSTRKIRVDSANTTPTHTPTSTTAPDILRAASNGIGLVGGGLNIDGLYSDNTKRPTVSFSPAVSELGSQRDHSQSGGDTKFFYASDAKAAVQPKQQLTAQDNKGSSFFYANGNKIPLPLSPGSSAVGSAAGSTLGEERSHPKFFHANGTPDLALQPTQHFSATGSSTSNSQFTAPRLAPRSPVRALSPLQRPPSPLKPNQSVSATQLKHTSTSPSTVFARSNGAQDGLPAKGKGTETARRSSGHERSASAGVLDLTPSTRRISNPVLPSPSFPINSTTAGFVSTPEELLSGSGNDGESSHSELQSPIKAGHSLELMNELAANARRERKVLDLEITNSSLAAINRTLEREMRKQTAELRRYRRLSRSGRLSINSSASIRTSSGNFLTVNGADGVSLSEMSEESELDEEEESSEEESIDEGSLSPGAIAENDARHREKDEKRLLLDLSKHQQLLIDSQNMNQSLKRCLGWTEELIKEGKKALAYNVRVSDIELGGRVLAPDEVEGFDNDDNESLSGSDRNTTNHFTAITTDSEVLEMHNDVAHLANMDSTLGHRVDKNYFVKSPGIVSVEISQQGSLLKGLSDLAI